jgi:hypothetical protein
LWLLPGPYPWCLPDGVIVLDVAFILGVLTLAGLVALVAKGVEKL